mmetsp:Transcript_2766/g.4317  ORF Transcript_2766/g.4317 Transcript_2766/m.4317 type:complete len:104 (-) Transcript_2766:25-336(-)
MYGRTQSASFQLHSKGKHFSKCQEIKSPHVDYTRSIKENKSKETNLNDAKVLQFTHVQMDYNTQVNIGGANNKPYIDSPAISITFVKSQHANMRSQLSIRHNC